MRQLSILMIIVFLSQEEQYDKNVGSGAMAASLIGAGNA
jgi:hypothetical protein